MEDIVERLRSIKGMIPSHEAANEIERLRAELADLRKPKIPLTPSQQALFNIIVEYIDREGHSPSIAELMELTGKASKGGMFTSLKILEGRGWIKRQYAKSRTIQVL